MDVRADGDDRPALAALHDRLFQTDFRMTAWSSGIERPSRLVSEKFARRAGSRRSPPAQRAGMERCGYPREPASRRCP